MDTLLRRTRRDNPTGFTGVKQDGRRWRASIRRGQKYIWSGVFDTPEEAHAARISALQSLNPETQVESEPEPPPVEGARWLRLNRGFALVDAEDYDRVVSLDNWRITHGYARVDIAGRTVSLQTFIMNPPEGFIVDHIDRNRLDCRKTNLRVATQGENTRNKSKNRNNTSGYIGVTWSKPAGKWVAQASIGQKHIYLGLFDNPENAARARDMFVRANHGDFAVLNFP